MQQDSARLEAFLKDRNLTEHEVAVMAGVSQSTVSRARHVIAQRSGRARKRLFIFLENELSGNVTAGSGRDQVHMMHYNFSRIHMTLKVTPAMAAGVTNKLWEIEDIVALLDQADSN